MKTFMGIYRPSEAMLALADGLEQRQDGQLVDMASYGHTFSGQEDTCFGCAATWALQKLHGKPLPNTYFVDAGEADKVRCAGANVNLHYEVRADALSVETADLTLFEDAINLTRMGDLFPLFRFFEIHENDQEMVFEEISRRKLNLWRLTDSSWEGQMPQFRECAELLEEMGF